MRIIKSLKNAFVSNGQVNAANSFLLIGIIFGMFFVLRTPLLWGADETFHIARIYQLSEGHLLADKQAHTRAEGGYGGKIPNSVYITMLAVTHDLTDGGSKSSSNIVRDVDSPALYAKLGKQPLEKKGQTTRFGFPNTAAYSPVAYVPSLAGIFAARELKFNLYDTVILLRMLTLLSFIAIVYIGLRITEHYKSKWIIWAVALIPMTLYEASIITADSLTNALALLFASLLLKAWLSPKTYRFTNSEIALLIGCVIFIPLLKPGYIPLVLLALFVPYKLIAREKLKAYGLLILALGVSLGLFLAWSLATHDVANSAGLIRPKPDWVLVDAAKQLHFVASHPLAYLKILGRSSLLEDNKRFIEMFGVLGLNWVMIPGISYICIVGALFGSFLAAEKARILKYRTMAVFAAVLGSCLIIATGMYITYTPVAAPIIDGIQGRYFLPLLPLFIYGFVQIFKKQESATKDSSKAYGQLTLLICALTLVSLVFAAAKYSYVTWG